MFTIAVEFVGHSYSVHMASYDAALRVAADLFDHSNVAPDSVTVYDFGEKNDQNQVIWKKTRSYHNIKMTDEELLSAIIDEPQKTRDVVTKVIGGIK